VVITGVLRPTETATLRAKVDEYAANPATPKKHISYAGSTLILRRCHEMDPLFEALTMRVREAGAAPQWAPFAVWPIAFLGGSLVNLTYCLFLLYRNKTWRHFGTGPREILNPALSACMWSGGISLYSSATTYLGVLGVSIGFGLFFVVLMLCGQLMGVFTGEWRQMPARICGRFAIGIALLLVAVVTFGAANYFPS
jgi:L-rhamnose-H+ transport protein